MGGEVELTPWHPAVPPCGKQEGLTKGCVMSRFEWNLPNITYVCTNITSVCTNITSVYRRLTFTLAFLEGPFPSNVERLSD